jgi:hypothetical protein
VLALLALDLAAVPAVLPSARLELGSSTSGLVWVQEAYLLALAVTLVPLAGAGGGVDRRVIAATGLAAFACGALLASTAGGTAVLVTGRALQGAGGAGLLLAALESLRADAGERRRPHSLLAAAALLAFAAAPLIGGALAENADWRWLFRLELVAVASALLLFGASGRAEPAGGSPDVRRGAALAAGLLCAAAGLIQSGPWGWGSPDTLLLLAAGAALLGLAWSEGLSGADAAALALAGCLAAALLLAPQYLELVRGLSPLRSALFALALTLPAATSAVLARLRGGRLPGHLLAAGGLACAAAGALGMTRIDPASSYALVVLSLALLGSGIGAAAGARTPTAAAAPGAALVVAVTGALFQRAQLDEREAGGSFEDTLAAGLAASGWLLAAILVAAALLAWRRASAAG